jgi:DNA polymerase III delta prime subunit
MAEQIGVEVHQIPSQKSTAAMVDDIVHKCHYLPFCGQWHLVLVDEADRITEGAQVAFLSILDPAVAFPPNTIFVFTSNDTEGLEKRFLSRCLVLEFST